ncbi:MAG: DUF423 domain-containing protein [Hyphomicrobiales bacterium]|nr:DUF423 domain-containing protein [Hyphomicrobiales bacterium]
MSYRIWLFFAGVLGVLALAAGSYGAHALGGSNTYSAAIKAFEAGVLYHALHALALLGLAGLMAATEGRRSSFASAAMHGAGVAFTLGAVLFAGGIYGRVTGLAPDFAGVAPVGGVMLMAGWLALAASALGLRR